MSKFTGSLPPLLTLEEGAGRTTAQVESREEVQETLSEMFPAVPQRALVCNDDMELAEPDCDPCPKCKSTGRYAIFAPEQNPDCSMIMCDKCSFQEEQWE